MGVVVAQDRRHEVSVGLVEQPEARDDIVDPVGDDLRRDRVDDAQRAVHVPGRRVPQRAAEPPRVVEAVLRLRRRVQVEPHLCVQWRARRAEGGAVTRRPVTRTAAARRTARRRAARADRPDPTRPSGRGGVAPPALGYGLLPGCRARAPTRTCAGGRAIRR